MPTESASWRPTTSDLQRNSERRKLRIEKGVSTATGSRARVKEVMEADLKAEVARIAADARAERLAAE